MAMQHNFSAVPTANISRSSFNRNFNVKTTLDSGYVVPLFVDEVLPGDTFNFDAQIFARLSTPVVPVMDDILVDTFYFFVPSRLVWDNWENLMTAKSAVDEKKDFVVPKLFNVSPAVIDYVGSDAADQGFNVGSVADYFGLPVDVPGLPGVNALPFRALNLIYNEWFRDENLVERLEVPTDDGPDYFWDMKEGSLFERFPLPRRCKRHDYFTSSLPWPQKAEAVDIGLSGFAPVVGNGLSLGLTDGTSNRGLITGVSNGLQSVYASTGNYGVSVGSYVNANETSSGVLGLGVTDDPDKSGVVADLSGASAVTINSLRMAFMLQQFYERDARGGNSRYTEVLRSHFDTISPDFRLQRPEYLGGKYSGYVNIHSVPQTSSSDSVTPQGNLAAYGVYSDESGGFVKSFVEHGYVIGLVSIRSRLSYQQGIEKMWSRRTREDFYWPAFAHLGEQAVLNKEIYAQSDSVIGSTGEPVNDEVFGYQERSAEYRYKPSLITGKLRSGVPGSLDVWHLAQNFDNLPRLNAEFIFENPPIKRILAVQDEPEFILDASFSLNCVRPMPLFGIPGFQSHF